MDNGGGRLTFLRLDAPLRPTAVVVARDPLVRSGLLAVLGAYPGLVLREAVDNATNAPAADVLIWDEPGGEATGLTPVLALVNAPHEARRALRAGARGAVGRGAPAESIAPAALAVAAGHWVVDRAFAEALLDLGEVDAIPTLLSPREHEVLALLSEGLSNREVAERLGISRHTAKFHVNAILDKLGASSRTEAVVLAARGGLLTL
jgi:two-component system nitrate/nitrite response regulator NarL